MQLRTNIFLRVALAILLPMTVLVLAATYYSEQRYQQEVQAELTASLGTTIAEIDRRIVYDRETFTALASAPAIEQYVPIMQAAADGQLHPEFFERTQQVNEFLSTFQLIIPSLNTLRILDSQANTLVKVRFGISTPAFFDGIESFPFAEEETDDELYIERLYELPVNEVGVTLLNQTLLEQEEDTSLPMLDYIMPLSRDKTFIGYLVVNILGEQIDRILDFAPRPNNGQLIIAEVNPDAPERNGVIIYDDERKLRFADIKSQEHRLQNIFDGRLYDAAILDPDGVVESSDGKQTIYYQEYLPYPNLLTNWVVAIKLDREAIAAPFQRIRFAILLFALTGLIGSLWLAGITAGHIARPVLKLTNTLKAYANGRQNERAIVRGEDEVAQLAESFNDMADTLESAAIDRDHAQRVMLQQAKLASIGQMAAGIGHELNNPLNNILTLSKLLQRNISNEEANQDIESLREEALRASGIVQGVLNFARQVAPTFSQFSVKSWLLSTLILVKQQAKSQQIKLRLKLEKDFEISGDSNQLQQVLINLLINAIQASKADDVVTVSAACVENKVIIKVVDQGCGINNADMDNIFDPFYTSKEVGEGNGLGLSISLGIIEQHNGLLTIVNNKGKGVTATITLKNEEEITHG